MSYTNTLYTISFQNVYNIEYILFKIGHKIKLSAIFGGFFPALGRAEMSFKIMEQKNGTRLSEAEFRYYANLVTDAAPAPTA